MLQIYRLLAISPREISYRHKGNSAMLNKVRLIGFSQLLWRGLSMIAHTAAYWENCYTLCMLHFLIMYFSHPTIILKILCDYIWSLHHYTAEHNSFQHIVIVRKKKLVWCGPMQSHNQHALKYLFLLIPLQLAQFFLLKKTWYFLSKHSYILWKFLLSLTL